MTIEEFAGGNIPRWATSGFRYTAGCIVRPPTTVCTTPMFLMSSGPGTIRVNFHSGFKPYLSSKPAIK